jgi:hypothetical protein
MKWNEWLRPELLGYYIPNGEHRRIEDAVVKPRLHQSAVDRKARVPDYDPPNFPSDFDIEPWVPGAR